MRLNKKQREALLLMLIAVTGTVFCLWRYRVSTNWIDRCLVGMHFRGEPMAGAKDVCEAKWRLRED